MILEAGLSRGMIALVDSVCSFIFIFFGLPSIIKVLEQKEELWLVVTMLSGF